MAAIREIVLGGVTEAKCAGCRKEIELAKQQDPSAQLYCEQKGICIYTHEPKVRLMYNEQCVLDDVIDFLSTQQILSHNQDYRKMIIELAGYWTSLEAKKSRKQRKEHGNTRR
jgi:hypothetical protein